MVGLKDIFAFSLAGSAFAVLMSLEIPFRKLPLVIRERRQLKSGQQATRYE
jgi:hypothetical protein